MYIIKRYYTQIANKARNISYERNIAICSKLQQFNTYKKALSESAADKEYYEAAKAFDNGDYENFLKCFFKAIHSRYDIEKPSAKRLIRKKLNKINTLKDEIKCLEEKLNKQEAFLKRLAAEYTILGKECENEKMYEAAIANYNKALELYPEAQEPSKRINLLTKRKQK